MIKNIIYSIFFSLFLLSGIVKVFIFFYGFDLPFDLTLIIGVLLLFQLFTDKLLLRRWVLFAKITQFRTITYLIILFYFWIFLSNSWSPSVLYSITKSINILTIFISLFWPVLSSKFNENYFFLAFSITSAFFGLWFVIFILPNIYIDPSYYKIQSGYLYISVISGVSLIMVITQGIVLKSFLKALLIIILLIILVLSGGRSALIAFLGIIPCWLVFTLFKFKKVTEGKNTFKFVIFFSILTLFTMSYFNLEKIENLFDRSVQRISLVSNFFNDRNAGESIEQRVNLIDFSNEQINSSLSQFIFGGGNGSFGVFYNGVDERRYPHNIFIEIFFEYGLIGLVIFVPFLIISIRYFFFNRKIWLFAFIFFQALKSNDLGDQRIFFALISIGLLDNFIIKSKELSHRLILKRNK